MENGDTSQWRQTTDTRLIAPSELCVTTRVNNMGMLAELMSISTAVYW